MALKKHKELENGTSGEYWKIIEANANKKTNELVVTIALFKDRATSDAGNKHLGVVHRFCAKKDNIELLNNLFEQGYEMIKAQVNGPTPSAISGKLIAYNDLKNCIDDQ